MEAFRKLGVLIEDRWRDANYDSDKFPEIAERALKELALAETVDPWEIVRWIHGADTLPPQEDRPASFGDPPVTLYAGPRFFVSVLYWLDGTTEIHQHGFSGAYQVLLGSSIHSRYDFALAERINEHLLVGSTELKSIEMLQRGDTRQIVSGNRFIHALFHLERPSATIVVRTYEDVHTQPQYKYIQPSLAYNPFFEEQVLTRKLQTVKLLMGMEHPDLDDLLVNLVSTSDFHTTFFVLQSVIGYFASREMDAFFGLSTGTERVDRILDAARRRHGSLANLLPPVVEEIHRQGEIRMRRGLITTPEHRLFLAILLNVPSRVAVLDLVKRKFPDENPVDLVVNWVEELSTTKQFGSQEPNVLGLEMDEDSLYILRCLLEGMNEEEVRAAVDREHPPEDAEEIRAILPARCEMLSSSKLFQAILRR